MALSGTYYKNVDSRWRLQAEWTGSQSVSGNYTDITQKLYWMGLDQYGTTYTSATKYGQQTINGNSTNFSSSAKLTGSEKKLIHTKTTRVYHNSDGSKSVNLSAYFDVELTLNNTYYGRVSISNTVTLNTIPRTSEITSSANFTAGSDYTISVKRSSTSFTHTVNIDVLDSAGAWKHIKSISGWATSTSSSFSVAEKTEIFKALNGRSSMSTRINVHTYSGSTNIGYETKTGTVTAPNASTLTSGTDKYVYIDETLNIGIARNDSEFHHLVKLYAGSTWIADISYSSSETSKGIVLTQSQQNSIYSLIPNDTYIDGNARVYTYYNNVLVRSYTSNNYDFYVRNSHPYFSSSTINYADTNTTTTNLTVDSSKIVQNNSRVLVTLPVASKAVGQNYASISHYTAVLNGVEKTASYSSTADVTFDFGTINAGVDQTLTIRAVDSRGYVSEIKRSVTMVPYSSPSISASAKRKNGFDDDTTFLASGSFSSVLGKNTISSVRFRYRKKGEATTVTTWANWTYFTVTPSGTSYTTNALVKALLNTDSWYVDFFVNDQLGSNLISMTVSTGKPIFFIDSNMKNVGVGKFPSSSANALEVAGNTDIDGSLNVDGKMTLNGGNFVEWQNQTYGKSVIVGTAGSSISLVAGESRANNISRYHNDNEYAYVAGQRVVLEANGDSSDTPATAELHEDGTLYVDKIKILSNYDASGSSSNHGLTVGSESSSNVKIDGNEISSFSGTSLASLHVNPDGGSVVFHNNAGGANLVINNGEIDNQGRINASLASGWANYGGTYTPASYWKDKNGVVHVAGLVRYGSGTIFTLPAGYRPSGNEIFYQNSGSADGRVDVLPDGRVNFNFGTSSSWISLAGISFKAEN